ncbi:MAG: DUF1559 domain-containing protein [Planctomycetaceae bacterium]
MPRQKSQMFSKCDWTSRQLGLSGRKGFTLMDLLVVTAVIGLIVALLLPAVQKAREAVRRTQCTSNLRQLGIAIHHYHDVHMAFPPGNINGLSMFPRLLPYLEQSALFDQVDFSNDESTANHQVRQTALTVLQCPTDPLASQRGTTNYVGNSGTGLHAVGRFRGFFGPVGEFGGQLISTASVSDGLSNTAAFSEVLVANMSDASSINTMEFSDARRITWSVPTYFSGPNELEMFLTECDAMRPGMEVSAIGPGGDWISGNLPYSFYNHAQSPNHNSCAYNGMVLIGSYPSVSLHNGGVNSCLGDGSVRFVSQSIDAAIWRAVGSRAGNEVLDVF